MLNTLNMLGGLSQKCRCSTDGNSTGTIIRSETQIYNVNAISILTRAH
jgi:hypothetical protein